MSHTNPGLILATQSAYKRELLARLPIEFSSDAADVDESRLPDEAPEAMAARLALLKAQTVAKRHPGHYVLGADQTIFIGDHTFGKPGTFERAFSQLQQLRGNEHTLLSAVALVTPDGRTLTRVATTRMVMRDLSDDALQTYLLRDEPYDCAGAYKVEDGGVRLFRAMHGDDYTNIVGLPLTRVVDLLELEGLL